MVNPKETDRRLYNDMLALANRTGNEAMAAKMLSYGEPPYTDLYAYTYVAAYYRRPRRRIFPACRVRGAGSRFGRRAVRHHGL